MATVVDHNSYTLLVPLAAQALQILEAWCVVFNLAMNMGMNWGLTRGCAYLFDAGSMKSFHKLVLCMIAHGYEKGTYVDGYAGFEC